MEPGTGRTGSARMQISYSKTERGGLEMGLRSEPQHWGPTGQIKARSVGAVGRVTGETRRTGTGNGSWAGEGVSGPQGEGLRGLDGRCAPEDQVGDRSGGRAQGEAGTAHSSTGGRSVAEGDSPRTGGHAPPKEEETQQRKGRAGRCQRSKLGVRGSQQLPSRADAPLPSSLCVPLPAGLHHRLHGDPPGGEREPGPHGRRASAAARGLQGEYSWGLFLSEGLRAPPEP